MRIVALPRLREWTRRHAVAAGNLATWRLLVQAADWTQFADIQETVGRDNIDRVPLQGGTAAYVFDIHGDDFRMITGIRFSFVTTAGRRAQGEIYLKEFLTHAEYDTNRWKERF